MFLVHCTAPGARSHCIQERAQVEAIVKSAVGDRSCICLPSSVRALSNLVHDQRQHLEKKLNAFALQFHKKSFFVKELFTDSVLCKQCLLLRSAPNKTEIK
jgi:hypothetical protein